MMKFVFREMPDLQKTGERKVFPEVQHGARVSHETIVNLMMEVTNMSRASIEGVFTELADVLSMYLAQGHSVRIDGLGTFDVALGMKEGVKAETVKERGERYNTKDVQVRGINFLPDVDWRRKLRGAVRLERVGTVELPQVTSTVEERRQKALAHLATNPFLRVSMYAYMTGLSRTKANKELNAFCEDPASGIASTGVRNQKVYVRRTASDEA